MTRTTTVNTALILIVALVWHSADVAARHLAENASSPTAALDRLRHYELTSDAGCGVDTLIASYSSVAVQGGCGLLCDAYTPADAEAASQRRCNAYVETADGTCLLYSSCPTVTSNKGNSTVGVATAGTDDDETNNISLLRSGDAVYARFSGAVCEEAADLGTFEDESIDCKGICNFVPGCSAYARTGATKCMLHSSCTPMDTADVDEVVGLSVVGEQASSSTASRDGEGGALELASSAAFTYLHRFHCEDSNIGQIMLDDDCRGSPELCTAECADTCRDWDGCIAFMLKESGKCKFYDSCQLKAVATNDYVGVMQQS